MRHIPRASLCITILNDEDYRVLMASEGGMEAFGVFVAMLILGRDRLQQGKAVQVPGTEALVLHNSLPHLLSMTHMTKAQLMRAMAIFDDVARDLGVKPWMHLDGDSRVVIRSFFKFNTCSGWGGQRPGAGRRVEQNQVDFQKIQLDSNGNQVDFRNIQDDSRKNHLECQKIQDDSRKGIQDDSKKNQDDSKNGEIQDDPRKNHLEFQANHLDSKNNHLDPQKESSWGASGTGTGKEENTPLPPEGGVGVSFFDPSPEEDEPFGCPDSGLPPTVAPAPLNNLADVERVAAKAEHLFPLMDFGIKVKQVAAYVPMANMDYALDQTHRQEVPKWTYVCGILENIATTGPPKPKANGKKETAPEKPIKYHKAPEKLTYRFVPPPPQGRRIS